jgi:hypothetical protein
LTVAPVAGYARQWKGDLYPKEGRMSAFLLTLAAGMALGDGPSARSSEVEQRLDLSGEWRGSWIDDHGHFFEVRTFGKRLLADDGLGNMIALYTSSFEDGGGGRFAIVIRMQVFYHGIYKWDNGYLFLCFCETKRECPVSFRGGDGQELLRLRRVKPGE